MGDFLRLLFIWHMVPQPLDEMDKTGYFFRISKKFVTGEDGV
jgi:hypothetical protein